MERSIAAIVSIALRYYVVKMNKSKLDETYEKVLAANLARVLDLLKFAEAKNAALLAFSSAWIVGLVNLLSSDKSLSSTYLTACKTALPLFVIAAVISIVSLIPKLAPTIFTKQQKWENSNLLFFGNVAEKSVEEFKTDVRAKHYPTDDGAFAAGYFDDLTAQISINSKIAVRKYKFFSAGARIALLAVAMFIVPTGILIYDAMLKW